MPTLPSPTLYPHPTGHWTLLSLSLSPPKCTCTPYISPRGGGAWSNPHHPQSTNFKEGGRLKLEKISTANLCFGCWKDGENGVTFKLFSGKKKIIPLSQFFQVQGQFHLFFPKQNHVCVCLDGVFRFFFCSMLLLMTTKGVWLVGWTNCHCLLSLFLFLCVCACNQIHPFFQTFFRNRKVQD